MFTCAPVVLALALLLPDAGTVVSTWTNGQGDSDWSQNGNWDNVPNQGGFPDNGNQGFNYDAVVRQGTVQMSSPITTQKLFLGVDAAGGIFGNGAIGVTSPLVVNQDMTVGGASQLNGNGGFNLTLNGALNMPASGLTLNDVLALMTTIELGDAESNSGLTLNQDSRIDVVSALRFHRDGDIGSGPEDTLRIRLSGATMEKVGSNGPFGVSDIKGTFQADGGTIRVASGQLRFPGAVGGATWPVTLNNTMLRTETPTKLIFGRSTTFNNVSYQCQGGCMQLVGGTFTITGTFESTLTGEVRQIGGGGEVKGGTLDCANLCPFVLDGGLAHSFTNDGRFRWASGTIGLPGGSAVVNNSIFDTISSTQGIDRVFDWNFTNKAAMCHEHGIKASGIATILNDPGATWTMSNGAGIGQASAGDNPGFVNRGRVLAGPAGGEFSIGMLHDDDGRLESTEGDLVFSDRVDWFGGTVGLGLGSVRIEDRLNALADITFQNGTPGLGEFVITGIANFEGLSGFNGGSGENAIARLTGPFAQLSGGNHSMHGTSSLHLDEGVIGLNGTVKVVGETYWAGGIVTGGGLQNFSNLFIEGDSPTPPLVSVAFLTNSSNVQGVALQSDTLFLDNLGTVRNDQFSTWRMRGGACIEETPAGADTALFINEGTFEAEPGDDDDGGGGGVTVNTHFDNQGQVVASGVTLTFGDSVEQFDESRQQLEGGSWRTQEGGSIEFPGEIAVLGPGAQLEIFDGFASFVELRNQGFILVANGAQVFLEDPLVNEGAVFVSDGTITAEGGFVHGDGAILGLEVEFEDVASVLEAPFVQLDGGEVTGAGMIMGDVTNAGARIGGQVVAGTYTQHAGGTLALALGERLEVSGAAALAGTLELSAPDGLPEPGTMFTVASAGSISGAFDAITGDVRADVTYEPDSVTITVIGSACPADITGDDAVGFDDLVALLASWGACAACPADLDGDGTVGFQDLVALLAAWGRC